MQYKKLELSEEIIEAASFLFAKKGIRNTSIRDIAKKVHTAPSNIYNYYSNKEEILDAVVKETALKLVEFVRKDYKEFLKQIDKENFFIQLDDLIQNNKKLQDILDIRFIVLMNACKKTRYAHYKKSIMQVVCDYTQEYLIYKQETAIAGNLGYIFIHMLIEVAKSKIEAVQDNPYVMEYKKKLYEISVDDQIKRVFIRLRKEAPKMRGQEYMDYINDYRAKTAHLDLTQYELVIEGMEVDNVCEGEYEYNLAQMFNECKFRKTTLIVGEEQIVVGMIVAKISMDVNMENVQIIIGNKKSTWPYSLSE